MKLALLTALLALPLWLRAADSPAPAGVEVQKNLAYKTGGHLSDYETERCKLDLYLPKDHKGFAALVWFHGGALTVGNKNGPKDIAQSLAAAGICMVLPNYRLSPKVKYPAYLEDAAAAFAWTKAHIAEHGGDPNKVFIGGHSAGGYITLMLGLDEHLLRDVGLDASAIAGLVPVSGQAMTHYTVRGERGLGKFVTAADEAAPVFHVRKDTPPMLVLYADHDALARAEENAYLVAMLKGAGNTRVTGKLITDRTHETIARSMVNEGDPARVALLDFLANPGGKAAAP